MTEFIDSTSMLNLWKVKHVHIRHVDKLQSEPHMTTNMLPTTQTKDNEPQILHRKP